MYNNAINTDRVPRDETIVPARLGVLIVAEREVRVKCELGLELDSETISGSCLYVGRCGRGCRSNNDSWVLQPRIEYVRSS